MLIEATKYRECKH